MGRKELEAEVLNELSKMEQEAPEAEQVEAPVEVEQQEGSESDKDLETSSSSNQDVDKDDGVKTKKSGLQSRINELTRKAKEAQEKAEAEAKLRQELEQKLESMSRTEDSDEPIEIEPSHKAYLTEMMKEVVQDVLKEQESRTKELEAKKQQEQIISTFQEKVLADYGKHYDEGTNTFDDVAANEIIELSELVTSNPSFFMPKIEKFGARRVYKTYILDEINTPAPKKEVFQSPSSMSKPSAKPLDVNLSNRDYSKALVQEVLKEL